MSRQTPRAKDTGLNVRGDNMKYGEQQPKRKENTLPFGKGFKESAFGLPSGAVRLHHIEAHEQCLRELPFLVLNGTASFLCEQKLQRPLPCICPGRNYPKQHLWGSGRAGSCCLKGRELDRTGWNRRRRASELCYHWPAVDNLNPGG